MSSQVSSGAANGAGRDVHRPSQKQNPDEPGDSLDKIADQYMQPASRAAPQPPIADSYLSISHQDFKYHRNARPAVIQRPKRRVLNIKEQRRFQTEANAAFKNHDFVPQRPSMKPQYSAPPPRPFVGTSHNREQYKWVYVQPPTPFKPVNANKLVQSDTRTFTTSSNEAHQAYGPQAAVRSYKPKNSYNGPAHKFEAVSETRSAFQNYEDARPRKPFLPERKRLARNDDRDWSTSAGSSQREAVKSGRASSKKESAIHNRASSRTQKQSSERYM